MASAIIRDVVVAGISSITRTENFNKHKCNDKNSENKNTTAINNKISQTPHRLRTNLICTCICYLTTPLTESLPSNKKKNANNSNTNNIDTAIDCITTITGAKNNQTLGSNNSYRKWEKCSCLKCLEEYLKFQTIESSSSSSNLNTLLSTTFENTTGEGVKEEDIFTPPRNHPINYRSLGKLQEKRSPLFGPPYKGVSLRSQNPLYSQNILQKEDLIQLKLSVKKYKKNIDYTATEALSMNGERKLNNGPVGTFLKSNPSEAGYGGSDINRSNGTPKNWTIMTSTNTEKREHLYKILVIGELGTGKTSFIKRYVHQFFSQNYRATIGVDFALKVLHWDPNTIVRLQLWDIAGQERFGNMTRVYYKEAVGAFIVFDVTRSGTFDCVSKWKEDLDSKVQLPDGSPIPCILLANKCDQDKQGVVTNSEKMDEYVKEHGFAGWFETSAKENINIDEAARALVNKILLNDKLISAADLADSEKFNLNTSGAQNAMDAKSKCSC